MNSHNQALKSSFITFDQISNQDTKNFLFNFKDCSLQISYKSEEAEMKYLKQISDTYPDTITLGDTDKILFEKNSENKTKDHQFFNSLRNEFEVIKLLNQPTDLDVQEMGLQITLGPTLKKKSLFLDLDETLICKKCTISGIEVLERPFVQNVLAELVELYDIYIFSAAHRDYVTAIIKGIDPNGIYFSGIFTREHCLQIDDEIYVKDLRIFKDRNLSDMVIVDNSPISFAFQLDNGVLVTSFFGDINDDELFHLCSYLKEVIDYENFAEENRKIFEYQNFLNSI